MKTKEVLIGIYKSLQASGLDENYEDLVYLRNIIFDINDNQVINDHHLKSIDEITNKCARYIDNWIIRKNENRVDLIYGNECKAYAMMFGEELKIWTINFSIPYMVMISFQNAINDWIILKNDLVNLDGPKRNFAGLKR